MATPPSKLSQIIANGATAPGTASPTTGHGTKLGAILVNGRRGEDVDLGPVLGLQRIELLGVRDSQEVESLVHKALAALGIDLNVMTADRFEIERAYRTLARAVVDPVTKVPIGSADEWAQLDNDVIVGAWHSYGDVRDRLDPLSQPMTDAQRLRIESAVKKKDATLLRTFGTVTLAAWLASTDVLPSTSPTPSSPSSDSSSDP